jgi:hypothetical protein
MPIMFNSVLKQNNIDPADAILLRHQDRRSVPGRTPYELWRDNRPAFELYQSAHSFHNRPKFARASIWASFVGALDGATMFAGLYAATYAGVLAQDRPWPHAEGVDLAGSCDQYEVKRDGRFIDLEGKLFIDWGDGERAWVQRADRQNKPITELRPEFKEPEFPGFLNFIEPLSRIESLPKSWVEILKYAQGVYVLTCPKTREQYVGSASGIEGFWQRWMDYARTGHGGDVILKKREPSDYQVSILEVAGSSAQRDDIVKMEERWKRKLQSHEMGLNG